MRSVYLTSDRFAQLADAAQAQGKTPDQLADEAIAMLLRRQALDDVMNFGHLHAKELGIPEADVDRLISEVRSERRHGS